MPIQVFLAFLFLVAQFRTRSKARPRVRARQRRLPWVHSTIRVTRETWRNFSGELLSQPRRLYCDDAGGPWRSPRTLADLQQIVLDARQEGATIRVFGSSHSWSRLVPNDNGYVVDNRMIGADGDHYILHLEPAAPDGSRGARATAPPGLMSSEFEEWLWEMGYSLPTSAFEDCFTLGGMAATATHGAGLGVATVSDLVCGMTFVDGLGNIRRWSRETATPDELAAIQCSLGCLGLIYDITFDVVPRVEVLHEARTIPYDSLFADTNEARVALRNLHENHNSVEFFWWPFRFSGIPLVSRPELNPLVWVLTMKHVFPADTPVRGKLRTFFHLRVLDIIAMVSCGTLMALLQRFPSMAFVLPWLSCSTNLWVSARSGAYRMPLHNGNHFVNATGVEFIRSLACEWSIPYERGAPLDQPKSYERVRQSFAVLHNEVAACFEEYPLTDPRATPIILAIEMRVIRSSGSLLSPGYQPEDRRDDVAYAAPEIVTTAGHPAWAEFSQRTNLAMTTQPNIFGDQVRCHHAKPFFELTHPNFPGGGMVAYLRKQYQDAGTWERFLAVRHEIDPDGIFLNEHLRLWFALPATTTAE